MNLELIKEYLKKAPLSELSTIRIATKNTEEERIKEFIIAFENSDTDKVDSLFKLGVSFDNISLWEQLVRCKIKEPSREFINYFVNLKLSSEDVIIASRWPTEVKKFIKQKDKPELYTLDVSSCLKNLIISKLESQILYSQYKEETFWLAKEFIDPINFEHKEGTIIKNFSSQINFFNGHKSIHKYIKESNKGHILFRYLESSRQVDFFIEDKDYGKLITEENKYELMTLAIAAGHIEKIKALESLGAKFPIEKPCYADLFLKTKPESMAAQEYVITHCDDITFGDQIILKTLLHSSHNDLKLDLIKITLERYGEEDFEKIPLAIKKRELSSEVMFVMKFMEYIDLKIKIKDKEIETEKFKFKI